MYLLHAITQDTLLSAYISSKNTAEQTLEDTRATFNSCFPYYKSYYIK